MRCCITPIAAAQYTSEQFQKLFIGLQLFGAQF